MSVHGWKIYIYLHGISGCESQLKSKLTFLHCSSAMALVVSSRADLMAFSRMGENIKMSQVEYIWERPQYYIYIISTHFCRQFFLDRPQKSSWHKHTGFVDSCSSRSLNCIWRQAWMYRALKLFSEPGYTTSTASKTSLQTRKVNSTPVFKCLSFIEESISLAIKDYNLQGKV